MSLSCGTTCIKYLLFLFNLLFLITGCIFIAVGVSVKNNYYNYDIFIDRQYTFAPAFLIGIGVLIFVISFFGCYGSIKENSCCTITFSTLLLLIFFLELAVGITGYFLKHAAHDYISTRLNQTMDRYDEDKFVTEAWDEIQINFTCCGIYRPEDWLARNSTADGIPSSCCETMANDGSKCDLNASSLHKKGCLEMFGDFIKYHAQTIEAAGLGIAFVQFIGVALSCYLSSQIRKGYQTV